MAVEYHTSHGVRCVLRPVMRVVDLVAAVLEPEHLLHEGLVLVDREPSFPVRRHVHDRVAEAVVWVLRLVDREVLGDDRPRARHLVLQELLGLVTVSRDAADHEAVGPQLVEDGLDAPALGRQDLEDEVHVDTRPVHGRAVDASPVADGADDGLLAAA